MSLQADGRGATPAPSERQRERTETMGGLAKGLQIIEAFGRSQPRLTVSEAAKKTGITSAAARRCLLTLESLGFVSYDGKYFQPTPRMARLSTAYMSTTPLPELARPHLTRVRDAVGESSSLAVLDGHEVTFIAREESERIVTTHVRLGAHLPAHASATGRVLLSGRDDEWLAAFLDECRLERTTPHTLMDRDAIHARIAAVRADGAAYTDEELELGVRTMAAPVTDSTGTIHAAMSVAVLASRMTVAEMTEKIFPILATEAAGLGAKL